MLVYIAIFAILALIALSVPDRGSGPVLVAVLLFLWWFMGLRYWVGCDFFGYLSRFTNVDYVSSYLELLPRDEPGFEILIHAIHDAGLSYMWLNIATSGIFLVATYFFAREFKSHLMIIALLLPVIILQLEMSGIRQGMAVSFLLLSVVALKHGSKIWSAAWILLGAQFHTSLLIMLPIAAMAGARVSTLRMVGAVAIFAPVAGLLLASRVETYQTRYIGTDVSSGGALIRYALSFIPAALFFMNERKIKVQFPREYDLLKLFSILALGIFPLVFTSTVALHRINYYVLPLTILVAVYVSYVVIRPMGSVLGRSFPAIMFGLYTIAWFLTSYHANACYIPYRNVSLLLGPAIFEY